VTSPPLPPAPPPASLLLTAGRAVLRIPRLILEAILAVIIVFQEWGWRPLALWLGKLTRFKPFAALERLVASLPPTLALIVFALPTLALLPLKLLALWLIATGHTFWATMLFLGAKIVGTALVARIFHLTQPALMRLPWFARLYGIVMPWKDRLAVWVRTTWAWRYGRLVKAAIKQRAKVVWARWKPQAMVILAQVRALFSRSA
jgi:hypothetical protein